MHQNTATYEEHLGQGLIHAPAGVAPNQAVVWPTVSAHFKMWAKLAHVSLRSDYKGTGLVITDSGANRALSVCENYSAQGIYLTQLGADLTYANHIASGGLVSQLQEAHYWALEYDSAGAGALTFSVSVDGRNWFELYTAVGTGTWLTAPDGMGIFSWNTGASASLNVFDWFRVTDES